MLTSSLSDYRGDYIIVRGTVTKVRNGSNVAAMVAERTCQSIALKYCTIFLNA